jgi:hypothetical protein
MGLQYIKNGTTQESSDCSFSIASKRRSLAKTICRVTYPSEKRRTANPSESKIAGTR